MDVAEDVGARGVPPRPECLILSIVVRNVPWAVPAISATVWDVAETTPRVPATAAVTASALMLAAPDTALNNTLRAI